MFQLACSMSQRVLHQASAALSASFCFWCNALGAFVMHITLACYALDYLQAAEGVSARLNVCTLPQLVAPRCCCPIASTPHSCQAPLSACQLCLMCCSMGFRGCRQHQCPIPVPHGWDLVDLAMEGCTMRRRWRSTISPSKHAGRQVDQLTVQPNLVHVAACY